MKIQFVNVTSVVWNEERLFELENGVTLHFLILMIFDFCYQVELIPKCNFSAIFEDYLQKPRNKDCHSMSRPSITYLQRNTEKKKRWATQSDTSKKGSAISISNFASTNMFARVIAINQKQPSHTHIRSSVESKDQQIRVFSTHPNFQNVVSSCVCIQISISPPLLPNP